MKIFWSYAKLDNKKPNKLTKLRKAFKKILDETTGLDNQVVVDEHDLRWGSEWRKEIERLIKSSEALISIVSPSYFNSRMCIYELKVAIENDLHILPIYYRECSKGLRSSFMEEDNEENIQLNRISRKLADFQYKDFRKLRNKDLNAEAVQDFLDEIAGDMV